MVKIAFKKEYVKYIVLAIFLTTLAIRLALAFKTVYFSDDVSYFALRQIEEISNTLTPLFHDPLSYGGRTFFFPPLFHYILGIFNIFLPLTLVAKVLPNVFASSLVIIIYFLTREITKDKVTALYCAGISGFIPIFFQSTVNSVTPYSLIVPLSAFIIFCFIKLHRDKGYAYPLIISISCLTFIHASSLILAIALVMYVLFLKIENIKESSIEIEVVLFSALLVIWFLLIIYRKTLLVEGLGIIQENIPSQMIPKYFRNITVLEAIAKIGIIPFMYGIVTIYRYLFKKKTKFTYLFISFALTIGLLLIIKSIEVIAGLMFLGMILTILYSIHFKQFKGFMKKTKFAKLKPLMLASLTITLIITQFLPSIVFSNAEIGNAPSAEQMIALEWLSTNTDIDSTILSRVEDGHKITFVAKRKNVMDSNFINAGDTQKLFDDISTIYHTAYKTQAVELLNKYDINYIYLSQDVKDEFNIQSLSYSDDKQCFEPVYKSGSGKDLIIIYKSKCKLEEA